MESLKAAVGLGDATTTTTAENESKGREPISGITGAGTADQPYDAGNLDEESQLTEPKIGATTTESTDAAAPLKSLAGDEPAAAPAGGILATLASVVGLGGSNTVEHTNADDRGQEPVSGVTGQGTADQPYDVGNEDGTSLGGKAHQQTGTSDGLQFIGGINKSHATEQQTHTPITQAVNEGALGGTQDPAQSNDGLAFVSSRDKHPTEPLVPKTSNHEPVTGTSGAYTIGEPLGTSPGVTAADGSIINTNKSENESVDPPFVSGNVQETSPIASNPTATPALASLNQDGDKSSKTGPAMISSLFSNPFAKRESISGASGEVDMDPKAKAVPGSEPIPELQGHAVPVRVATEKRPLPTPSSATPHSPVSTKSDAVVVEPKANGNVLPSNHLGPDVPPGAASPKRDKGKGKLYGDTDSNSTRSSITRNESIATSQTGVSTRDSRRFSSHTSGKIPTAGGIVLGERASKDRERRASLAPSGHSAVTSEPQYAGRESLQKVAEDAERAPAVHQTEVASSAQSTALEVPPVAPAVQSGDIQPPPSPTLAQAASSTVPPATSAPVTPRTTTVDAPQSPTSARVPGTEKSTLSSPPPSTSRFSEHGIRDDTSSSPDPASSTATAERKPSLVTRIGRKLSIKSSSKSGRSSASGAHPETIVEKK